MTSALDKKKEAERLLAEVGEEVLQARDKLQDLKLRDQQMYHDDIKAANENHSQRRIVIKELEKELVDICPHNLEPETSDVTNDYHNRIEWKNYYCGTCGTFLRRE